jgi:hypothetical protein
MKNSTRVLMNDVLTGLLVAATAGAIIPHDAAAQLTSVASSSTTQVFSPFLNIVGYISYAIGTVMVVAGIAHAKKHADNPGSNPLGPALGRLGAGAAFLAAPSVVGMLHNTTTSVISGSQGSITGNGLGQTQ